MTERVFDLFGRVDAVEPGAVLLDAHRSPYLWCVCEADGGPGCPFAYGKADERTTVVESVHTALGPTREDAIAVIVLDELHRLLAFRSDRVETRHVRESVAVV
jgi:hypothetical protein